MFRQQDEPSPEQWRFLAEAGKAFAASLDLDTTVRTAVDLATRTLADFVCIDLVEEECLGCLPPDAPSGWLRRLGSGHRDPKGKLEGIEGVCPGRNQSSHPSVRAITNGQPVLVQRSEGALPEIVRAGGPGRQAPALGTNTILCVPLCANDRTLGAMLFGAEAGLSSRAERALAVAFADRVALALNGALLYAQAQSATRRRDDVIGSISHDLRNPLNVMTMVLDALRRDLGDPGERMQRRFDAMQRSSERMTRLIDELLDVTHST
jgi:GAF domain-containing protein